MATFSDQNSEEWDRIKNYVGGAKPKAKHPIQQEMDRIDMRKPQHLDDGGMVDPLSQDSKNLLAPASMGAPSPFQVPPQAAPPVAAPVQRPVMPPAAPVQPQVPPQAPITPPAPDTAYNPQATQALGGINPQELQAYLQKVNAGPGLKERLGNSLTGAGDAMVSLAGGHSNFQGNLADRNQQQRESLSKIPGEVTNLGKEQHGLSKDMAADDPTSMRSFIAQQSNAPLLKQAGFSSQDIKKIPASAIDGLRGGTLDAEKIRADYGLRKATVEQTGAYQQGMLGNAKQGLGVRQQEADTRNAEIKAQHPFQNALGMLGNSGGSSGPQQVSSQAQYNALPSGSQYLDHNGQARVKK